jgi:hypothetical protein
MNIKISISSRSVSEWIFEIRKAEYEKSLKLGIFGVGIFFDKMSVIVPSN